MSNERDIIRCLNKGEDLLWSGELTKINKSGKRQNRRWIITNDRFFNLGEETFTDNFMAFFRGSKAKRSIHLKDV